MSYGIKVSKPGIDVVTATEKDLVISSEYPSLKVAQELDMVTISVTYPTGEYRTFAHGLGYTPTYRVFYDVNDGKWREATESTAYLDSLPEVNCQAGSDDTYIYVGVYNFGGGTVTVRYKIFIFVEGT